MVSGNVPDPGCKDCIKGYLRIPKEHIGWDVEYCGCLVEHESLKRSVELLKYSNLSSRQLDGYTVKDWIEYADLNFDLILRYVSAEVIGKNWMFIHGNTGSGKTYSAVIACQIALLQEKSVYFTNVTELMDNLRPSETDKGKAAMVLESCKRADVLVLDDIGHEKSSDWVRERLYLIINNRWNSGKITIFTSNFSVENLRQTVSEAVYSRVKGDSLEIKLLTKKDRRLNN